jgi:hypothetical protein
MIIQDFLDANNNNFAIAENTFYRRLCIKKFIYYIHVFIIFIYSVEIRLNKENKSLKDYGYTVPANIDTPLQREILLWDKQEQQLLLQELFVNEPPNPMQQLVYDNICNDIMVYSENRSLLTESKFYFIDGDAGVGKSSVMRKLHAFCRSKGILIGICAATTLAALNFKGGMYTN